jgi:protein ImuA
MALPHAHPAALSDLRHKIECLGTTGIERQILPFGVQAIDGVLPGGGLALGAVHEICEPPAPPAPLARPQLKAPAHDGA